MDFLNLNQNCCLFRRNIILNKEIVQTKLQNVAQQ